MSSPCSPVVNTDSPRREILRARRTFVTRRVLLRRPNIDDGASVHQLIRHCPPLNENSLYCNLLQTCHFAETSVAAELDGKLVGFISAYLVPERPDTLFIWQIAVAPEVRGVGLASRMIREVLLRPTCVRVHYLETTITPDNRASRSMFRSLAHRLQAEWTESLVFDCERHFRGRHESELLLSIALRHNAFSLAKTTNFQPQCRS